MLVDGQQPLIMCATVKPATSSGRIELFAQSLQDAWGYGVPRHDPVPHKLPLNIISPSSSRRTNATFGELPDSQQPETVNALIDADLKTDIAAGACYNDTWVELSAI